MVSAHILCSQIPYLREPESYLICWTVSCVTCTFRAPKAKVELNRDIAHIEAGDLLGKSWDCLWPNKIHFWLKWVNSVHGETDSEDYYMIVQVKAAILHLVHSLSHVGAQRHLWSQLHFFHAYKSITFPSEEKCHQHKHDNNNHVSPSKAMPRLLRSPTSMFFCTATISL